MDNDKKTTLFNSNNNEDQIAVIGKKFDIKGDLSGIGAAIISGRIEGNISATRLVIERDASILGNITCLQLDVSGHVRGLIEATDVVIRENATIEGDLNYSTLTMENGGVVSGKLKRAAPKPSSNTDATLSSLQPQKTHDQALTRVAFPADLSQKLRAHEARMGAHLSLIDGSPLPPWIALTQDKLGLMVNSSQLRQLEEEDQRLGVRLHVGSQYFDIHLPVQI